jgi:hypothetical protein
MGRKAYWVSSRQPGCRNITIFGARFFLSRGRRFRSIDMLIQPPPSAAACSAPLPGSATFPAPPLPSLPPIPSLSATAAASFATEAVDQALAKHLANLTLGISRLTTEREALAGRVEQLAALNFETADELVRAREEQAREAARAAARAESSAAGLKQLQERLARLSGQFQEVQNALQQGAARNASLGELAKRAQDELTQLARERNAALARADEARARAEEATARLRRMQQERDTLRGELAALAAEHQEISARLAALQGAQETPAPEPAAFPLPTAPVPGDQVVGQRTEFRDDPVRGEPVGVLPDPEQFGDAFGGFFPEDAPLPCFDLLTSSAEQAGTPEILKHLAPLPEPLPEPTLRPQAAESFPSFPGFGDDLFFGSADSEEVPSFALQPGLQGIECRGSRDVVSLHQPVNVANLSLDGKGQEICQGYICCIRRGAGTEVFAAVVGVKSGRIRIYAPEEQPRDEEGTARAVRGAVAFGEQVGLLMEEKTGESAGQRTVSVRRCPVFKFSEEG